VLSIRAVEELRRQPDQFSVDERRALAGRLDTLDREYLQQLPDVPIARCPHDQQVAKKHIDIFGLDGPWWETDAWDDPPSGDEHVLTYAGAVQLERGWSGSLPGPVSSPVLLGPEVPYVIPRILDLDGMACVITSPAILPGVARVFLMTYFASPRQPAAASHQQWLRDTFYYVDAGGRHWGVHDDEWDFDIARWVDVPGKLWWTEPDDPELGLHTGADCPFVGLEGERSMQVLEHGVIRLQAPPSGRGRGADLFD
jgi:hypothetical protein